MATESSAIARFVNQAQSHAINDPYARPGVVDITQAVPPMSAPGPVPASPLPPPRGPAQPSRGGGGLWLGLVGFVIIGGAVAGGYLLAQQQSGAPEGEVTDAIGANAALAAADDEPDQLAAGQSEPDELLAGAERTVAADAAEDTINPDTDPGLAAREAAEAGGLDLELAKKTGFDILVEPAGAKVSLDGHNIGIAPLRVRNLLPGVHGIDIEGPTGFFGKHLEFELEAGQAQVIELELVAIDGGDRPEPDKSVALAPKVEPIESTEKDSDREQKKTGSNSKSSKDKSSSRRVTKAQERAAKKASAARSKKAMAGAGEVSLGTLMLGAKPPCQILIDGKNTGLTTPQRSIQLPEGTHRVVLVNDQHGIKKSFKVNIKAGRTTRAIQDLTKKL